MEGRGRSCRRPEANGREEVEKQAIEPELTQLAVGARGERDYKVVGIQ